MYFNANRFSMTWENGIHVPFPFFVFTWHWKTDLNFAECFSFSPNFEKTDLNFVFRFSFSHHFEKRIWISFLYGLLLKNRSEFRLSFLHDLKNGSLHQSSHLRSPDTPTGLTGAFTFYASEFSSTRGQSERWTPPPPHDKHGTPFFNKG